ncbi:MAG: aldehyde dehydrogenase family protein [Pirellulaceae bacterium]
MPLIDGPEGQSLLTDSRVGSVILTGAFSTASLFKSWCPSMRLCAETSGKNAMIVTAAADLDLAVKDIVRGAFGHAGQKCSATSLVLAEASVFDDPKFARALKDAAKSLTVGSAWNPSSVVTPVIREPGSELKRGLTQLDGQESWLLQPAAVENNPCLWTPGIRWNVQRGSWFHRTECFGPVLGVMRVDSLEQAIEIQNENEFGLTGGLHSLDRDEIALWRERVEVGNAYINRGTTGAIVQRQPFGGWKHSCIGPGPKAGGPNYVAMFARWHERGLPQSTAPLPDSEHEFVQGLLATLPLSDNGSERIKAAAGSIQHAWTLEFSLEHDPSRLHGETNHFRYRPRPWCVLRVTGEESPSKVDDLVISLLAARRVGCTPEVSFSEPTPWSDLLVTHRQIKTSIETAAELAQRIRTMRDGVVRYLGPPEPELHVASIESNIPVVGEPVVATGRRELTWYLREQAISETVHRYGNLQRLPDSTR